MKKIKVALLLLFLINLTGCSSIITLTNYLFPNSMGIEYVDGKFMVSLVIINPLVSSNLEQTATNMPNMIVVQRDGKTINEAIELLQIEEYGELSPAYLKSIIINVNVFDSDIKYEEIMNVFIQNPNYNLSNWIFFTDKEIKEIYSVKNIMVSTPYYSLLNYPSVHNMGNIAGPVTILDTMVNYREGRTAYVPVISYLENEVLQDNPQSGKIEKEKSYYIPSFCFLKDEGGIYCFTREEMKGYRWYNKTPNINISVDGVNGSSKATKVKFKYYGDSTKMKVTIDMLIIDNIEHLSMEETKKCLIEEITKEIKTTYLIGVENDLDVYYIKDHYSRYKNKDYQLNKDNLEIIVEINLLTRSIISS